MAEEESEYYDMQVATTNNYVCENGFIHHNSGKTWVGCTGLIEHTAKYPKINSAYYAPTYKLVKDVFWPTIDEVAYTMGFECRIKVSDHEVHLSRGGKHYGVIHSRTMDNPANIVGFKSGHALVDELDIMDPDKAAQAWRKILARMRYKVAGLKNGVDVTTTPEGFKFTYDRFKKSVLQDSSLAKTYGLIQASTYDNEANLPPDYIDTLVQDYPEQLRQAYLNGQFVNLTSGTVYKSYNREAHRSTETIRRGRINQFDKVEMGEPLFIGMDFNVTKMAATIYVQRNGGKEWHAVDEIKNGYDTPDVIEIIRSRFYSEDGRPLHDITIYPDATGKNREAVKASISDISLLESQRWRIRAHSQNPPVRSRILAVNAAFHKGLLYINERACPVTAECLEQQVYADNGEPDKKAGKDHQNDATGYPIAYEMPIHKPVISAPIKFSM